MGWWGKCIGGAVGMMLGGGPLGAVIGMVIGHGYDENSRHNRGTHKERTQLAFFTATFSVMGHICKADHHVSKKEIGLATHVIEQMSLNKAQKKMAIGLFNQGKKPDFPLKDVMQQFKKEARYRTHLYRMFLEIQIMAAYADGVMHENERRVLAQIAHYLNFPTSELDYLCMMAAGTHTYREEQTRESRHAVLEDAYKTLGIEQNASAQSIKRAYRRLISQHHPDKLVSKGLPDEMIKLAEARTHTIRKAYETIKKKRGL